MDSFEVDPQKLWRMACRTDAMYQLIRRNADRICSNANSMGSTFKTERYKGSGGTSPKYVADTQRPKGIVPVGMVYTGNYAAMKDNMKHNTLLKSL